MASAMMTAFGGAVAGPIAVRSRESTTTMRVNEVIMIRIDGAIESTVSSAINWIARSVTPPWPPPRLMLMSWACAGVASAAAAISVAMKKTLRGSLGRLTKTMTSDGQAARPSRLRDFQRLSSARARGAEERARRAVRVRRAARVRPAAHLLLLRDGEALLQDAAPSRRDSGPRSASAWAAVPRGAGEEAGSA